MADSNDSICYVESDDNSFLSGSVNYSTECSEDHSVSDISVLAKMEVKPYLFEPEVSNSESVDHGEDADIGNTHPSSTERVGNNHW